MTQFCYRKWGKLSRELCCRLQVCVLSKLMCWSPKPQDDGIRCGVFRRWLAHEGKALRNGVHALKKGTPGNFLVLSAMWGHNEKIKPDGRSAKILVLDFPASRTARNKCLLFNLWDMCAIEKYIEHMSIKQIKKDEPQRIKQRITIWASNSTCRYKPERFERRDLADIIH